MLAALLLQSGFLPAWRPLGVVPDLGLVVLVLAASWTRLSTALVLALTLGLGTDLAAGANFGLHTGSYTLTALILSTFARAGFPLDRPDAVLGAIILGTLGSVLVGAAALLAAGGALSVSAAAVMGLKQMLLNLLLAALVWPALSWARGGEVRRAQEVMT